jgi:hypothetical protein
MGSEAVARSRFGRLLRPIITDRDRQKIPQMPFWHIYNGVESEANMVISFRCGALRIACFVLLAFLPMTAQPDKAPAPLPGSEYSGMYSFLHDGEFVQVSVENQGRVTGFVSRYGDLASDRGAFLDQFFKQGKLDGNKLTFTTEIVHGIRFEFRGTVERGEGKKAGDEAYYVLKGTLTEYSTDDTKKTSSTSREVALKSFPQDLNPTQTERK